MIYVLAYPRFAPSCARKIAEFRARHEPQRASLVPPHITLVFGSEDLHLNTISALANAVASQTRKFAVSFNDWTQEFDPFERKHKIALLCGDGSADVSALHAQLYDGPHRSGLDPAHPFRPHMTIATSDTRAESNRIDVASAATLPLGADLHALELVRFANGRLTPLETFPFSS